MNQRTLIHVILVALVAVVIVLFPEERGRESLADYPSGEIVDEQPERDDLPSDAGALLPGSAIFPGIRGEAIGLDGTPIGGLHVEAIPAPEGEQDGPGEPSGRIRATTSLEDGSFELFSADPNSALVVRSTALALISERRRVQPDGSITALLVLAPTAAVAGRVIAGRPGQRVLLRATHSLPLAAQVSQADRELVYVREVETRGDGSFDFGRIPCSQDTVLEAQDARGALRRVSVPYEGTLTASIDLRLP